jgi:hypothetical protein
MMGSQEGGWSRGATVAIGLLLIVVGAVLLAVQYLGWVLPFDLGQIGWPLWILVPGAVLLVVGLVTPEQPGAGLAIGGSIITMIGLVLAYQSVTGHYASWAYAWALVAPGGVGAGLILWGLLHLRGHLVRDGLGVLGVGLVLFLVGFAFFEGLLQIGGERGIAPLGRQALPAALILAGVVLIITRLWPRRRDEWRIPPGEPPRSDSTVGAALAPPDPALTADATGSPQDESRP